LSTFWSPRHPAGNVSTVWRLHEVAAADVDVDGVAVRRLEDGHLQVCDVADLIEDRAPLAARDVHDLAELRRTDSAT
jgi:hypothetical protein